MNALALGLITGILFGFLLQKGRVLRFEKQIGALRLRDMTILKFMLSAIIVGMIGVYLLVGLDILEIRHKPLGWGAVLLGGVLFGAGWAVMGYCPGTSMGALGEGRWHAVWAILGMVVGASVFARLYPFLDRTVLSWGNAGPIGLPDSFGWNPWLVIIALTLLYVALFVFFEKKRL